jgi:hypothetical protein
MAKEWALVIGLCLLVAASALTYGLLSQGHHLVNNTSTSKVVNSNVPDGLELTATIEPNSVAEGQNVSVVAEVNNTQSTTLEVDSISMTNPAYGPCGQGFATGVRVYRGHYSLSSLSQANELLLYNPSLTYLCPAVFTFQYTFSPDSAMATIQASLGAYQAENETRLVSETSVLTGYWVDSGLGYVFQRFPVGQYTVLIFDAWGDQAVGYFQVSP